MVKGLITLRAQLDIYNDFMQDSGGKLGVSNWKNVNQEVVVLFSDLDQLIEKSELSESQMSLVKLLGSGLQVDDVAYMLGIDERRVERSINTISKKIVRENDRQWLIWAHMNYIESQWKTCRVCGDPYPANNKFYSVDEKGKDGLRSNCMKCHRISKNNKYFVQNLAKSGSVEPVE